MSEYKRPNFDGDWWQKVEEYLKEHPEEGFESDEVKQFIKYVVNQYITSESPSISRSELKQLIDDLR